MRMEKGRLPRGPLPRRSIMGYTAGYLMFFVAGLIGFIRLARGHAPGPLVILSVLLSSLLVGAVGWLDYRAGRIEPPPGFMEGLRRLWRLGRR
jgi:hypothetical protein